MFKKTLATSFLAALVLCAQVPNPTQRRVGRDGDAPVAMFRIEVVARSTQAVNYRHRGGATKVDFQGTALMSGGKGDAKVESERGDIKISADLKNFVSPSTFGPEYLTYVLWAISPDGRPQNLGELTLSDYGAGSSSHINTTSPIQTFGMIVTAEPYYGVTQPSDVVVMENVMRPDTMGVIELIDAKYELLPRGIYTMRGKAPGFVPQYVSKKLPFELYEAQNAVQIARLAGADRYAADSYQKANEALNQALRYQAQKPGQKPVITMAREAVVRAEDSRVIAIRRQLDEQQENERMASLARENAAKADADRQAAEAQRQSQQRAQAEAEAREQGARRAQADADRAAAERASADARLATQQAQAERAAAERAKAEADAARQAALAQQQVLAAEAEKARQAASESDRMRQKAEEEQAQLRQRLLDQFNQILQTRDTTRGLVVNMSDVLFDSGRYTLKPGAREKLARLSGIVLGHPGLNLEVEGHTDSVGGDDYNMRLSENRANTVREFLVTQGINAGNVTAKGFGKTMPVADNANASGRQMNRRVELVISGTIIGTTLTSTRTQVYTPAPPR